MCISLLALSLFMNAAPEVKSRTFLFTYEFKVTGLPAGEEARIWVPEPQDAPEQDVKYLRGTFPEMLPITRKKVTHNNYLLYLNPRADQNGEFAMSLVYRVTRRELRGESDSPAPDDEKRFLKPDAKVPAEGKYRKLIEGKKLPNDPMELTRALYDLVNGELRYSKEGTGWGQGDVNWVCDSKYGNCTDFHSLFIGLARANKMPGKFEIGFAIPEKRGKGEIAGYHCWAKVKPAGKGWLPVDISQANQNPKLKDYCFGNLSEDRVTFSVGRDIELDPKPEGGPLNYFIYPYVEVKGKPHPAEKIVKKFSYEDVEMK